MQLLRVLMFQILSLELVEIHKPPYDLFVFISFFLQYMFQKFNSYKNLTHFKIQLIILFQ